MKNLLNQTQGIFSIKALVLFVILTAASCQAVTHQPDPFDSSKLDLTPARGGMFIEASIGDASFLNPVLAADTSSGGINNLVYNGLVKYDKDIRLVGDLAKSWDISNEGKTITFHLRENVRWHDGAPFTAEDVLFTYQTLVDPKTKTPYSSDYLLVKEAVVVDALTFRVTYKEPFSPAMESWAMGIIPKHIFGGSDINTHPANRHPVGTGPYKFKSWETAEKIVLEANLDYFEGPPYFDRHVTRIIPDQSVQFLELRQGTLSTMSPTPDQYNGYDEFFRFYNKYRYPAFRYDYIAFNLKNPLFQDREVRLALGMAVNKADIIKGVYQGLAVSSTGPFPPTSWAWNPKVSDIPYDPEQAKKILMEKGWQDLNQDGILEKNNQPFRFTLMTNQGNKVREMVAQIVKNSLQKIGVDCEIRVMEWSVFINKYINNREFEAVLLAWSLSRDPDCYSIWHSSQREGNRYNFVSYINPEVDRLLEEGRKTFGIEKRQPIYHKIHALVHDDVPYIFLTTPDSLPVVHKKIQGVQVAPAGLGWNFIRWYIPREWQTGPRLET